MNNVIFIESETFGEVIEHVIIDIGNNEFTSMPKSTYEKQLANEAKTK